MNNNITLIVHDLSSNPIVRAYPVGLALEKMKYNVKYIGFSSTGSVYYPYEGIINAVCIKAITTFDVLVNMKKLIDLIEDDIIYAFKPLITTFLPAQICSLIKKNKVILDIEDNDVLINQPSSIKDALIQIRRLNHATSYYVNRPLHESALNNIKTVSTTRLKNIYGGELLYHGVDKAAQHVSLRSQKQKKLRNKLNLPEESTVFLFAGTSHPHKGLLGAVNELIKIKNSIFYLVGQPYQDDYSFLKAMYPNRVILGGLKKQSEMQVVVQASDIVIALQEKTDYAESQLPAKLLEAFKFGRPVLTTNVGDNQNHTVSQNKYGRRGWIITDKCYDEVIKLSESNNLINTINIYGKNASNYYNDILGIDAIINKLNKIL